MSGVLRLVLCATALLVWSPEARTQSARSAGGMSSAPQPANRRNASRSHHSSKTEGLTAQNRIGIGGVRVGVGVSASAPNAVTDPGFASRLGQNVGLQAVSPVTMPPGIGNINHPGMQPLPLTPQPLPTGSAPPIPNINFPGGAPGRSGTMAPNPSDGSFGPGQGHPSHKGHFRGPFVGSGTVIVGVPVYPYTVYVTTPAPTTLATTEEMPSAGQSSAPTAAAEPVITLLAFKDGTIFAVVDYWLEGDVLHYATLQGARNSVPLGQLDLPLTQRLNRERHVRFVLEARP